MQRAFAEKPISKASAFDRHKLIEEGRERVEDKSNRRRPRTSTDELHVNNIKNWCCKIVDWLLESLLMLLAQIVQRKSRARWRRTTSKTTKSIYWWRTRQQNQELVLQNYRLTRKLADVAGIFKGFKIWTPFWKPFLHYCTRSLLQFCKKFNQYPSVTTLFDFWKFSKLGKPLHGHSFDSIQEIIAKSKKELIAIPEDDYEKCLKIGKSVGIDTLHPKGIILRVMN